MHRRNRQSTAFTLIELLVSMGVIAVLIGITLPTLLHARRQGDLVVVLSNLRDIGQTTELYLQRSDGVYPYHGPDSWVPFEVTTDSEGNPVGLATPGDVWSLRYMWFTKMRPVAPWIEYHAVWQGPSSDRDATTFGVTYHYSCSFFARPEVWIDGPPISAEQGISPVRSGEISHPALKVMFYDSKRPYLYGEETPDDKRGVLMADGSASLRLDSEAKPPRQNRIDGRPARAYLDTPLGVRGRDF